MKNQPNNTHAPDIIARLNIANHSHLRIKRGFNHLSSSLKKDVDLYIYNHIHNLYMFHWVKKL